MKQTYYDVLHVPRNASADDIKKAYRRLISLYHPDHNPSPEAAPVTAELNEAYSTLSDQRKRSLYDAWLHSSEIAEPTREARNQPPRDEQQSAVPEVRCGQCGKQDSTLRLSLFYYVMSFFLVTYRKGASGLWCERCRGLQAAKWSIVTGLLGWWGIPWGPIYTIQALFVNAKGGVQPKAENAALLRVLGYQLYGSGKIAQAAAALRASLSLEKNLGAEQLSQFLSQQAVVEPDRPTAWRFVPASVSLAIVVVLALVIWTISSQPSGYIKTYEPPQNYSQSSSTRSPHVTWDDQVTSAPHPVVAGESEEVNKVADELAQEIAERSPVVGTHFEAGAKVTDHELDRSRFDAAQLDSLATRIRHLLDHSSDPDGFVASAYFNAKLFAVSVHIEHSLVNGFDINEDVAAVSNLTRDPKVEPWLSRSRFFPQYNKLLLALKRYERQYVPGTALAELEASYKEGLPKLEKLEADLSILKQAGNSAEYNVLVDEYNAQVRSSNGKLRAVKLRSVAIQKLDLAFNRCFDPAILMSKFQKIDLTSHSTEIDSMPEPATTAN